MSNESSLQRFIEAQETSYTTALSEVKRGRKQTHWMWYIFPQLKGLGVSSTAQYYGLADATEAEQYAKHPVLGQRLLTLCEALLELQSSNATTIMGSPDDVKLKSSMTLFGSLPGANPVFQRVLDKFYQGAQDPNTLRLLSR
ncbi:DUF1810 domain-containing protein [Hymenobacter volaticus]|uniref:DUF1810 domain-containing protein n=1 Tax=Hymenobacter volaticus TaxID=2932254 RepID=A0ABY4GBT3_9BACT|nr:DUF1810 domain-containing protein [Hymenobacter volaticus]UOQ68191.1 DUF1810 domain-containing protein [Hymenobacter volaticus]